MFIESNQTVGMRTPNNQRAGGATHRSTHPTGIRQRTPEFAEADSEGIFRELFI